MNKVFKNNETGLPTITSSNTLDQYLTGTLCAGFNSTDVTSLTISDNVATVTVLTGHGITMVSSLVGPVIEISGAVPEYLNGEWRVASVPSSTVLTFSVVSENLTATGTIAVKMAGMGYTKVGTLQYKLAQSASTEDIIIQAVYEASTTLRLYVSGITLGYNWNNSSFTLVGNSRGFIFASRYGLSYTDGVVVGDCVRHSLNSPYKQILARFYYIPSASASEYMLAINSTTPASSVQCRTRYVSHSGTGYNAVKAQLWDSNGAFRCTIPGFYQPFFTLTNRELYTCDCEGRTKYLMGVVGASPPYAIDILGDWYEDDVGAPAPHYTLSGVTKLLGTPTGGYLVSCHDRETRKLVQTTVSGVDGAYQFSGLTYKDYVVFATDGVDYNAAIADRPPLVLQT